MREPFPWIAADLAELEAAGLRRRRREVHLLPNGACEIDGRRLWNFASNDYLGLAHDARVLDAARGAIDDSGLGARASALVVGRTAWHVRLEQALARFEGKESAILFPTGYAANAGTIAALVDESDVVFCDRLNHASLVDGCRLSGAKLRVYRHTTLIDEKSYKPDAQARDGGGSPSLARWASESRARLETLERELRKAAVFRRRLIVTESVFSMDGDVAPLRELCDLAEKFTAEVMVDEAHGTGVFGEYGRGACEALGVEDRVAVRVGTLSKAIGTLGGFVAGPQRLIDWLWNKARPQIFSTALPPAVCAAACAAIEVIERDPERLQRLWRNCEFVRTELARHGLAVLAGSEGPIIPIVLGTAEAVVVAQKELEEPGCLVAAIRPPTVPQGTSRLRISLSAAHDEQALACLVEALGQIAKRMPAA